MAVGQERPPRTTLPYQQNVADFYGNVVVEISVAFLIGANFLTNIVEKDIDPKGVNYSDTFYVFEVIYNVAFTMELFVNLYAHWWCEFWNSGWNRFDVVVVTIGVLSMAWQDMPSSLSLLRMMRAFRVFRLFKRVKSLNKIITSIVMAIPGMAHAFLILVIVMSIFAIIAVELYSEMADSCHQETLPGCFTTGRGNCYGPEYFGTFSRSIYTFFQVLTTESWSEAIGRPAIWYYVIWEPNTWKAVGTALFFVAYVWVTTFMLFNVVVAVLLEKMTQEAVEEEKEEAESDEAAAAKDAAPTVEELAVAGKIKLLNDYQEQVGQLVKERNSMRADIDAFRSDVADLKQKLAALLKIVSSD